jgi:hypothetical protein
MANEPAGDPSANEALSLRHRRQGFQFGNAEKLDSSELVPLLTPTTPS